jgi:hypothetical protein
MIQIIIPVPVVGGVPVGGAHGELGAGGVDPPRGGEAQERHH